MVMMSKEKISSMIEETQLVLDAFYRETEPTNEKDKKEFSQTISYYLGRKHLLQEMLQD